MRKWSIIPFLVIVFVLPFLFGGCDEDIQYYKWNLVQLESKDGVDYVCGNGSPYKFFVNPSLTSKNVLIYYEGGGACWDYPSCSGQSGIRGAANPNGIPDDYMEGFSVPAIMSPFIFRAHPWERVATQDWTLIFVPYCTGDIFIGDNTAIYTSEDDTELTWHHNGFKNTQGILDWMTDGPFKKHFKTIPKLMVTGCSAGGAGAFLNYHFIRDKLKNNVDEAILLNDSGPIYYTTTETPPDEIDPNWTGNLWSGPLHTKIQDAWGVGTVLDHIDDEYGLNREDYGSLNTVLSNLYPDDKLAHTQFTRDAIYSGYSYDRFYDPVPTPDKIHAMWGDDQTYLLAMYNDLYGKNKNIGYFVPYYRPFNESHCSCVLSFDDTHITGTGMNVGDYANSLLDSRQSMTDMRILEEPSEEELTRPYPFWNLLDLLMGAL
ncbi:pectin acetylesterase-family hydrolase [Desulfoluna sp.]|uniref:pectin acetylesterase-family hydrolase n=1 Tax=Desulfoluna sp. TaxID=2045199 RepID=UPI002631139A|nr:pectin acetylesterase-family hydrolase [Desulfoluna sp.]